MSELGKAMKGVWYEYCHRCQKVTLFRHLDCADCKFRGKPCPIVLCTEFGDGYDENENNKRSPTGIEVNLLKNL